MADLVRLIFVKPIRLASQVVKICSESSYFFYEECEEVKSNTVTLLDALRKASHASQNLYERPTREIVNKTTQVLAKAHSLVTKCRSDNGFLKRAFTIIPASSFRKMSEQLKNSTGDVKWLLMISMSSADDKDFNLPPFAMDEPILCLIWEQSAAVHSGSHVERSDAAASLVSIARDSDRYRKQIIQEGGIGPLLKLVKYGNPEGQESAAHAIGLLGSDPDGAKHLIDAGVCSVFAEILKEGTIKVQATVAWAVSELARSQPKCQHLFAQHNVISLLVSHLAFEIDRDDTAASTVAGDNKCVAGGDKGVKYEDDKLLDKRYPLGSHQSLNDTDTVASFIAVNTQPNDKNDATQAAHVDNDKQNSVNHLNNIHDQNRTSDTEGKESEDTAGKAIKRATSARALWHLAVDKSSIFRGVNRVVNINRHDQTSLLIETSTSYKESEDSTRTTLMKEMAARALWYLAIDNAAICRSITESRAMLCFAVLLERGTKDEQYNSAMAVMEITSMSEKNLDLERSAFKPNSPTRQAVVDQLFNIIEHGESDSELLIPCVKSIGNLARNCRVTEAKMISPLVRLLVDHREEASKEASIVLSKAVCHENYLRVDHSKAILSAGAAKHLVDLVYFGERSVQIPASVLLSYISSHVPDSEELVKNEVQTVIEWAECQVFAQHHTLRKWLHEAINAMELYQ